MSWWLVCHLPVELSMNGGWIRLQNNLFDKIRHVAEIKSKTE